MKDKIHRDNWAANKVARKDFQQARSQAQSHAQPAAKAEATTEPPIAQAVAVEKEEKTEGSTKSGWFYARVKVNMMNKNQDWEDMRKVILLDNQSSENVFSNPDLVHSIWRSKKTLNLATNAGVIKTTEVATVPQYGEVWYNPEAITNISVWPKWQNNTRLSTIQRRKMHSSCISEIDKLNSREQATISTCLYHQFIKAIQMASSIIKRRHQSRQQVSCKPTTNYT